MKKEERILTPAELKRKERFEAKAQEFMQQGYRRIDLTVGVLAANALALVLMLPVVAGLFYLFSVFNHQHPAMTYDIVYSLIVLAAILVLTVVHEAIHGVTWALFTKERFRAIEFGVIWSMLTPYCTCKEALTKPQYILGSMMPTVVVGILPALIAIIGNFPTLFLISAFMIVGGGGDALIILKLLLYKGKGNDRIYMDHPYQCGIVVFERTA